MGYFDMDYIVRVVNNSELLEDDEIIDVSIKRTDHYCEKTGSYWNNNQDEALYLKVRTEDNIDKIICVAKNMVKEHDVFFENPVEKETFYETKHQDEFYNHLEIYLALNDKQAIELLDIMRNNIDDYDYNFQYCNQDKVIKNIVKPNLDDKMVEKSYSSYIESSYDKSNLKKMLLDTDKTTNNVVQFSPKKGK